MATCKNCKARLSCSCQMRTSTKGISCCSKCIGLVEKNNIKTSSNKNSGVILSVTATKG